LTFLDTGLSEYRMIMSPVVPQVKGGGFNSKGEPECRNVP